MLEREFEERLDALEKGFEDLFARVNANEKSQAEEVTLIPGAEYDFVPSYESIGIWGAVILLVNPATGKVLGEDDNPESV